ncbi:MAG: LTA synthase family protein [Bacteroidia bacterium]|nr:LTA synthase family protein [Bacteroidia bacterium]
MQDAFYGLRFDTFSIFISNSLFILLSSIPSNLYHKKSYQSILKWLFVFTNSLFIMANCVDIGYFPFIKKRSTSDLFEQIGGQTDMSKLLPQYIKDFWWVLLIYILLVYILIKLYKRLKPVVIQKYVFTNLKDVLFTSLLFLFFSGCIVIGMRGGLQRRPIDIVNAGSVTVPEEIPIVLNTPFTLIKSLSQKALIDYGYYNDAFLKAHYNTTHYFKDSTFKKENVVVIMLESFAKEYTKIGTNEQLTPFLDSLMDHSLVFTNAYSNGTKSIEGIPAILSSLPSLMENPFINSIYANNIQTSFASILGKEGYSTAFFHGGINGSMNFDDWAPSAGYSQYFGRNEYGNDADFDGFWGIWDEPYLKYTAKKMSELKAPFHSAIFTISSHHPYFVPEKYKGKFKKGPLENSESIQYADYALKQFFIEAKKQSWYNNTFFILCADHASLSDHRFFKNVVGNQSIPIVFFKPDNSLAGKNSAVMNQMDILPSALNMMGYNKPFFSLGRSFLDTVARKSYFYANSTHYVYNDSMVYSFSLPDLKMVYNYKRDSTLDHPILNKYPEIDKKITEEFKVFIQLYNQTLINNSATVK